MTRHLPGAQARHAQGAGFEDRDGVCEAFRDAAAREPPPIQPEEPAALKPSVGRSERKQRSSAAPKKTLAVDEEDEAGVGVGAGVGVTRDRRTFAKLFARRAVQPLATAQPPVGPLEHQIPITLAEEEAEQRGGERRAWRPAPMPPRVRRRRRASSPNRRRRRLEKTELRPPLWLPRQAPRDSAASVSEGGATSGTT